MVTGGYDRYTYDSRLDTTEVYSKDGVWKTVFGKLPTKISCLVSTTLRSRVLVFC